MPNASRFIKLASLAEEAVGRASTLVEKTRDEAKDLSRFSLSSPAALVAKQKLETLERLIEKLESVAEELQSVYNEATDAEEPNDE
jgi:hypothetical protein